MATSPVTYRVSPEVDAELKRLAEKHGGVDKALRVLLESNRDLDEEFNIPVAPLAWEKPKSSKRGPRPKGDKNR